MSALAGRVVVVTRPREQARGLCDALEGRGARTVLFPTIAPRPLADPGRVDAVVGGLAAYAWIVFTSANAVRFFGERLDAAGAALPPGVRVAAVGPATARALAGRGLPVHAVPEEFRGGRVAEALGAVAGRHVLLPRADLGREETVEALRARGAVVHDLTVYHTAPAAPDPEGRRALDAGVDAVTFTSPSAARNFATLLGDRAIPLLHGTVVACIGPSTADAVRALGVAVQVQPDVYTVPSLVAALEAHFAAPAPVPGAGR